MAILILEYYNLYITFLNKNYYFLMICNHFQVKLI